MTSPDLPGGSLYDLQCQAVVGVATGTQLLNPIRTNPFICKVFAHSTTLRDPHPTQNTAFGVKQILFGAGVGVVIHDFTLALVQR